VRSVAGRLNLCVLLLPFPPFLNSVLITSTYCPRAHTNIKRPVSGPGKARQSEAQISLLFCALASLFLFSLWLTLPTMIRACVLSFVLSVSCPSIFSTSLSPRVFRYRPTNRCKRAIFPFPISFLSRPLDSSRETSLALKISSSHTSLHFPSGRVLVFIYLSNSQLILLRISPFTTLL
jgi:hypothetical protein